ncbi:SnoaL-like domain-containing protein [Galbibacter orientalis]|uniref:SnoaL-like domain-containing protein n=1 Tax=Galbibacter orientalis TaxID=453852 RepID=UPI0030803ABA
MNTKQIAKRFVSLFRQGRHIEIYHELYDMHAISKEIENPVATITEGKHIIINEFLENQENIVEIHHNSVSEPLIADNYFVLKMTSDITFADIGRREMEELCLYKIENGKITEAQFFYSPIEATPFLFDLYKSKKSLEEELFV